jgi:glutaredoxin
MKLHLLALAATVTLLAPSAHALYKVVGPDGQVTFTDRPPAGDAANRVSNVRSRASASNDDVALPQELRQAAQKFPVTLYTADKCEACRQGRELLLRRGVPFQERTATTAEDRAMWEQTTGTTEAPVMQVGGQQLRGFESTAWNETLDLAGYPSTSKLPTSYRQTSARPLATPKAAPAPREAPRPAPEPEAPPPAPGSIRF